MSSSARLQQDQVGPAPGASPAVAGSGWTVGRNVAAVGGAILAPAAAGIMICGIALLRGVLAFSQHGWLTSGAVTYTTGGRALVSEQVRLRSGDLVVGITRAPAAARLRTRG